MKSIEYTTSYNCGILVSRSSHTACKVGWPGDEAKIMVDLLAAGNTCEVLRSHPSRRDKHKEIRDFKSSTQ